MNCLYCQSDCICAGIPNQFDGHCPGAKATNANRIRAMSDEELAEFISGKARTFGEEYEGYMSALDWLKSPVEVDE